MPFLFLGLAPPHKQLVTNNFSPSNKVFAAIVQETGKEDSVVAAVAMHSQTARTIMSADTCLYVLRERDWKVSLSPPPPPRGTSSGQRQGHGAADCKIWFSVVSFPPRAGYSEFVDEARISCSSSFSE